MTRAETISSITVSFSLIWQTLRLGGRRFGAAMFVACATALAAGCADSVSDLGTTGGQTQTVATARAVAFEPLIGLPDNLAPQFAADLGNQAATAGLAVVAREETGNAYRVKGYFSAIPAGTQSRVFYVWDIFDASGQRTNRIEGERLVPASGDDPWSAVTPAIMAEIAQASIGTIASYVNTNGASTSYIASETSALAMTRPDISPLTDAGVERPSIPRIRSTTGPTVFVDTVRGMDGDAGVVLANALRVELQRYGMRIVATPVEAAIHIVGEGTQSARQGARHAVGIIWTVAGADGERLGTVRQMNKLAPSELSDAWTASAQDAATSAAPGIVLLSTENS